MRCLPDPWQVGCWRMPECEERIRQRLVFGARRAEAKANDHAVGCDRHQQVKTLVPAQAIAPADVRELWQPSSAPAFGIAGRHVEQSRAS